jgi:hypothetical protein
VALGASYIERSQATERPPLKRSCKRMAQPGRRHPVGSGSALPHHMAVRAALCSAAWISRPQGPTMHLLTSALAPVPHTPGILMGHPLQPFVSTHTLGRMHL